MFFTSSPVIARIKPVVLMCFDVYSEYVGNLTGKEL